MNVDGRRTSRELDRSYKVVRGHIQKLENQGRLRRIGSTNHGVGVFVIADPSEHSEPLETPPVEVRVPEPARVLRWQ